jgi:hypothetical protein
VIARESFLQEEFIQLELREDLVPQPRAGHPLVGELLLSAPFQRFERFLRQYRPYLRQPPPSLPFLTLPVKLLVDPRFRLLPSLFRG